MSNEKYNYSDISRNFRIAVDYSIHFQNFEQETLILSRLRKETFNPGIEAHPAIFSTLHALAASILPKDYLSKLDGKPTWDYVEAAVVHIIPEVHFLEEVAKEEIINSYYFAIRAKENDCENTGSQLAKLRRGEEINNVYQTAIRRGFNWEESMIAATNYLNNDNDLRTDLAVDNILIIDMEVLKQPYNKNTLDFLNALYLWGARRDKNWSFDVIDPNAPELLMPMHVNIFI